MSINWLCFTKEVECWVRLTQSNICIIETADSTNVFPVTVEYIRADFLLADGERKNFLTKVSIFFVFAAQHFFHCVGIENVNTHRSKVFLLWWKSSAGFLRNLPVINILIWLWLFHKGLYTALVINLHDTKTRSVFTVYGSCCNCDLSARFDMCIHKCAQIHLVKLVTRKNDIMSWSLVLKMNKVLSNGIGSTFIPARMLKSLLCSKNFYESARKTVEIVRI